MSDREEVVAIILGALYREEVVAIILGALYRDRVTGFTGRAVQITTYLSGCDRVGLQPEAKDDNTLP